MFPKFVFMLIAEINDWLRNPNRKYKDGVALYEKFGKSSVLKKVFSKGENFYTWGKLEAELSELRGEKDLPSKVIKVTEEFKIYSDTRYRKIDREKLPDRLKELDVKKGRLFQEASNTGAMMRALPEFEKYDDQRRVFAERIEKLFDAIDAIWAELNYFLDHGKEMPEEDRIEIEVEKSKPSALPKDKFQLMKKRASQMSMRTRAKNDKALFNRYDNEIKQINMLLNE